MVNLIIKEQNFSYSKRHLFDMLDLLVNSYKWKYVDKECLLKDDFNKYCLKTFKAYPKHILLISGSSEIINFHLHPTTKISYIIDDLHVGGVIKQNRIKSIDRIYKILSTYGYAFDKFYPSSFSDKVIWFPHSARYIIPFNNDPIHKILLAGRIHNDNYPNRTLMLKFSKWYDIHYEKTKLNGYRAKTQQDIDTHIYGKKFYQLINKYLCSFTCDLNASRPYIVAKHFEIMASGSLLLACNPNTIEHFQQLGFYDMIHYISCNPDNMLDKVKWILDKNNLSTINNIRKNGYELVKKNHTWIHRTNTINKILK